MVVVVVVVVAEEEKFRITKSIPDNKYQNHGRLL